MTPDSSEIYKELNKPPLSPPGWVFGPVWTVLYVMIAVAGYRIITAGISHPEVFRALIIFAVQLVLNLLWPILYFTKGLRGEAFAEILVLWGFIVLTLVSFYPIDALAGWLLVPYLLWVTFAVYLNAATWWLNRHNS